MKLQQQEQFYQMTTRPRINSKAASVPKEKEDAIVTEIVNGLTVSKPAKKITYLDDPKQNSVTEKEAVVIDLQEYAMYQYTKSDSRVPKG